MGSFFTSSSGYLKDDLLSGIFFGTVTPPEKHAEYLYLVLYKHNRTSEVGNVGNHLNASSTGEVEIVDGLLINGVEVKLTAKMNAEPTGKLKNEEYTLNGEKIDLARGRLFLVDLTGQWP